MQTTTLISRRGRPAEPSVDRILEETADLVETVPLYARPSPALPAGRRMIASDAASFELVRPRLFGIAYRVLGSAAEADDVLQDAWIRWERTDRSEVRDSDAFLAATTTRLAINVIQSARSRHETHIGAQLADRIDTGADPCADTERGVALAIAVRRLLEKLGPVERAAYVLREAFDYPYRRVGRVLGVSEVNARQLVTRARRSLGGGHRRPVDPAQHRRLLVAFAVAARSGDLATLERLLVGDVPAGRDQGLDAGPTRTRARLCGGRLVA
jgi:RNA polymerase sigma-70 factor (ECF subfamily)